MPAPVHVVDHPLVQHKLTRLRRTETPNPEFRRLLHEVAMLLGYEVTHHLALTSTPIETPVAPMNAPVLAGKPPCLVSVLRAGDGLLQGLWQLMPDAAVGHIGVRRNPKTLEAERYYRNLPPDIAAREAIVVDPMLATGNSAAAAIAQVAEAGPKAIRLLCLVAVQEGIDRVHRDHPDVPIHCAALDERLNEKGYIVPGLGDAGDRIFGT